MSRIEDKAHNRAHWDAMAPRWKAWWERYGPASQPVSDWLVRAAEAGPGARVLDLATGLGEPALTFARAVGPAGQVLGIDQSEEMIRYARETAAAEGLAQLRFEVGDVELLDLPDTPPFDTIASRWGLMFCTDLVDTLARIRVQLKPGGKLVTAVWSGPEHVPLLSLAPQVMQQALQLDLSRPGPGPFTLSDSQALTDKLRAAGFRVDRLEPVDVSLAYDSAQAFLSDRALTSPVLEDALAGLSQEQRARFDAALEAAVGPWRSERGIILANRALCLSCSLA